MDFIGWRCRAALLLPCPSSPLIRGGQNDYKPQLAEGLDRMLNSPSATPTQDHSNIYTSGRRRPIPSPMLVGGLTSDLQIEQKMMIQLL